MAKWQPPRGAVVIDNRYRAFRKDGGYNFALLHDDTPPPDRTQWLEEQAILDIGHIVRPSRTYTEPSPIEVHPEMIHDEIVGYVGRLTLETLTADTNLSFVEKSKAFFNPAGTSFMKFYRKGYNVQSVGLEDWSQGQPEWKRDTKLRYKEIEKKTQELGMNVHFDRMIQIFVRTIDEPPLKFAFDPGKALYCRDEVLLGTPKYPWERLFVKM